MCLVPTFIFIILQVGCDPLYQILAELSCLLQYLQMQRRLVEAFLWRLCKISDEHLVCQLTQGLLGTSHVSLGCLCHPGGRLDADSQGSVCMPRTWLYFAGHCGCNALERAGVLDIVRPDDWNVRCTCKHASERLSGMHSHWRPAWWLARRPRCCQVPQLRSHSSLPIQRLCWSPSVAHSLEGKDLMTSFTKAPSHQLSRHHMEVKLLRYLAIL